MSQHHFLTWSPKYTLFHIILFHLLAMPLFLLCSLTIRKLDIYEMRPFNVKWTGQTTSYMHGLSRAALLCSENSHSRSAFAKGRSLLSLGSSLQPGDGRRLCFLSLTSRCQPRPQSGIINEFTMLPELPTGSNSSVTAAPWLRDQKPCLLSDAPQFQKHPKCGQ